MFPGVDSASKNKYRVNPGGKGGPCVRLTTYHIYGPMSRNLGALTSWNPVGLFRPVMGQLYLYLYLLLQHNWMATIKKTAYNKYFLACNIQLCFQFSFYNCRKADQYKFDFW
jgi:hypothetical protein